MAIGTITMILTNVGLQIYNNWCNNRQSEELQRKREEFELAAKKRQTEHMLELLREGQNLAMQLEAEHHQHRMDELKLEINDLLHKITYEEAISNWPLRVLPIVMKNQAVGNLLANQEENIALHVVFTCSNYKKFNTHLFPLLEKELEQYCNKHWSSSSTHPVLFYSGAWIPKDEPSHVQVSLMKASLNNLPTLLITPYFQPNDGKLVFQIYLWGMGAYFSDHIDMQVIELKHHFSNKDNYDDNIGVLEETMQYLVTDLQCLIGYLADTYFWSSSSLAPHLPSLIINGAINTDGIKHIVNDSWEYYENLYLESVKRAKENPFMKIDLTSLYNEVSLLGKVSIQLDPKSKSQKPNSTNQSYTTMEKKKVKMDGNLYSVKRDELLQLLKDTLKLPNLPEDTKREFSRIKKKCLENQYSLILIGEFQGGKSTTFDALCGGHEISPRGALTKTSACKITATNLSSHEKEFAEIHWKTSEELILGIQSIFAKRINKQNLNLPEKEIFTPSKHLDFNNPLHVQLMRTAIDQEWDYLDKNKNAKDFDDLLEIVKIAEIIMTFYNHRVIVNQEKKNRTSIEDVSKLIVFPETWNQNWVEGRNGAKRFKPEEVLFAFVANVDCHIHSKHLERLGCSIVDCPGLFASAWDTKVAQETIPESDAILYLLGGEKQMTNGDKKALREIKSDNPNINNIFFAINQKKNDTVTQNFLPTDLLTLKELGFNKANIKIYNALLFYLGQFGLKYLAGEQDEHSIKQFNSIAMKFGIENESLDDNWKEIVKEIGYSLGDMELKKIENLNNDNCSLVLEKSRQHSLFSEIEKFIIENKAYSILVENGANKAYEVITSFENRLKQKEKDAQKTAAERQEEFNRRISIYNRFVDDAEEILENSFPENIIAPILNSAYTFIFQDTETVNRIALKCSIDLLPAMKSGDIYFAALWYRTNTFLKRNDAADIHQQKIKEAIQPILKNAIEEVLRGKMNTWMSQMKSGNSPDFEMYFLPELTRIKDEINKKWENVINECPELKGYDIDCTTSPLNDLPNPNVSIDTTGAISDWVVADAIKQILILVISFISYIITIWILDGILTGGLLILVGIIVEAIVLFAGGDYDKEEPTSREELNKKEMKLYDAIQSNIFQTFNNPIFRKRILWGNDTNPISPDLPDYPNKKVSLVDIPNQFIQQYKNHYVFQLKQKADKLQYDIEKARMEFAGAHEELEIIAKKAKDQREMYVHPLTIKIVNFIKSVIDGKSENK